MRLHLASMLIVAVMSAVVGCSSPEPRAVREIWEWGDRDGLLGYAFETPDHVAWSQVVFYDDWSYRRVFAVKRHGPGYYTQVLNGRWDGEHVEEIASGKFTDLSMGWARQPGESRKHKRVYHWQDTAQYPTSAPTSPADLPESTN